MKPHLYLIPSLGLLAFLWSEGSLTALSTDPTVQEIVNRAIARSESQLEANIEAKFESQVLSVVDSLDGEGTVTKSETNRYSRYPLYGAVFEELIEKEGRPLSEKEARKEKKRRDEFIAEVKERVKLGKPPQPEDERQVRFNREFMSRYQTTLVGEESIRGSRCWVVYFEPRKGKLPVRRRMDEALNRSTGRIWISQTDFGLVRAEFEMREPIRYLAGLLATVRNTVGRLEFNLVDNGVWLPIEFELGLDMRILFKNLRRSIKMRWSDYRRAKTDGGPRMEFQETAAQ